MRGLEGRDRRRIKVYWLVQIFKSVGIVFMREMERSKLVKSSKVVRMVSSLRLMKG